MKNVHRALVFTLATLSVPGLVHATNGYFLIGYGAKSLGMGGVGVALPQDSLAAASNPAGISFLDTRVDLGMEFFNPPRRAGGGAADPVNYPTEFEFGSKFGPEGNKSGSNEFLIPSMGGIFKFNRKLTFGFAAVGAGSNTRYSHSQNFFSLTGKPPGADWGTLGVNLIQMQMLMTGAYKIAPNQSVGASLDFAVQQFRAYGLGNFGGIFNFSSDIDHLTNQGNDWSYGAGLHLGWMGVFLDDRVNLGANYASRTYMTRFRKYAGLFAQHGSFDIPEHYALGIAVKATKKITVAADIQRIMYHNIKSIGDTAPTTSLQDLCTRPIGVAQSQCSPGNTPQPASNALGADNGFGFGWKNQTVYKLGADYKWDDRWTTRIGVNYGKTPIPKDQLLFNLIAPALTEVHITLGATYAPNASSEINAFYTQGLKHAEVCAVNDGCKTMLTQAAGTYVAAELEIRTLGIGYSLKF